MANRAHLRPETSKWYGVKAIAYARISRDPDNLEEGVGRQQDDNLDWVDRNGVPLVGDPFTGRPQFVDDDVSASDKSRKERKAYKRLLEALEDDYEIRLIIAWVVDRFLRRNDELEELIKLAKQRPGGLWLVTSEREYNLLDADDVLMLTIIVAVSARESKYISMRTSRERQAQRTAKELPHGVIFGWAVDGQRPHTAQARVVRQMVEKFLAGESLNDIARWANAKRVPMRLAGVPGEVNPKTGKVVTWKGTTVKGVISHARHFGHYSYRDPSVLVADEQGRMVRPKRPAAVILHRDTHKPLPGLRGEQYEQVMATLGGRARAPQPPRRVWLTRLLYCSGCGAPLTRTGRPTGPRWRCAKRFDLPERCGSVTVRAEWLEAWVEEAVWSKVDKMDLARMVRKTGRSRSGDAGALTARLAELDALTERNAEDLQNGMSRELVLASDRRVQAERESITAQLSRLAHSRVLAPYVGKPGALKEVWERLSPDVKREIVRETCSLERTRITVYPVAVRGSSVMDTDRFQFVAIDRRQVRRTA